MLHLVRPALHGGQALEHHFLFDAYQDWLEAVRQELLLFTVDGLEAGGVNRLQLAEWHMEPPSHLTHSVLALFKELVVGGGGLDRVEGHAVFQHDHLPGILGAGVDAGEVRPQPVHRFSAQAPRMLEHTSGLDALVHHRLRHTFG